MSHRIPQVGCWFEQNWWKQRTDLLTPWTHFFVYWVWHFEKYVIEHFWLQNSIIIKKCCLLKRSSHQLYELVNISQWLMSTFSHFQFQFDVISCPLWQDGDRVSQSCNLEGTVSWPHPPKLSVKWPLRHQDANQQVLRPQIKRSIKNSCTALHCVFSSVCFSQFWRFQSSEEEILTLFLSVVWSESITRKISSKLRPQEAGYVNVRRSFLNQWHPINNILLIREREWEWVFVLSKYDNNHLTCLDQW